MLFVCSYQFVFSQSSFGIGLGVGHQFGLPGIRASYKWNRWDASTNLGIFGGLESSNNLNLAQRLFFCTGAGISYRYTREDFLVPGYISYNLGFVFTKNFDGYNYIIIPKSIHTLTLNHQIKYIRIGFGVSYIPANKYSFLPSLALGLMFPVWNQ